MTDGKFREDNTQQENDAQNRIANGIPMTAMQMREYLQEYHGIPIAIREQGSPLVSCTYCYNIHEHDPAEQGHVTAGCIDDNPYGFGIIIGEKHFMPSYGYTIYEFRDNNEVNELITPNNLTPLT